MYYANTMMAGFLERYLRENETDILVMPHLFPAETITYMKRRGKLAIPAVAIATDYTCIPFWEETDCDAYVLPHPDLAEEYIQRGIRKKNCIPSAFPTPWNLRRRCPGRKPEAGWDWTGRRLFCWSWEAAWDLEGFRN